MKCFIDSNILISAGLFPNSVPDRALLKALSPPHKAVVCDYSLDEVYRVINRKFPNRIRDFESFLSRALFTIQLVQTPTEQILLEENVRDIDDRPILRAAIVSECDYLITGDKDLLEANISVPNIITPAQFLEL